MTMIYIISKYITFIGAILKGFWEHLFCRILGVPVQDAHYLKANELCGHVDHDFTKSKLVTFLICYLPGLLNRVFGYGMIISGFLGLFYIQATSENAIFWIYLAMLYIGISLMCNNAPLYEDALNNWELIYSNSSKTNVIVKLLAFIPSLYFLASAWLEKHGISLIIYVVAVVVGIVAM